MKYVYDLSDVIDFLYDLQYDPTNVAISDVEYCQTELPVVDDYDRLSDIADNYDFIDVIVCDIPFSEMLENDIEFMNGFSSVYEGATLDYLDDMIRLFERFNDSLTKRRTKCKIGSNNDTFTLMKV